MPSLINADMLDTSPPEWTVDGIIPRVGFGILHGPSYSGKSLVADNELALAIANGSPFFGKQSVKGCTVVALGEGLYDAGVRKDARLARQARDDEALIERGENEEARDAIRASLPEYTDERLFVITAPFTIPVSQQGEPSESMSHAIAQLRVIPDLELLVIDALSDFSGGLSISNDASANRYVLGLKMLVRELDCVVLCVHHNTADDKKMIGAQRFFNAADFVIKVSPDDNEPGELKTATMTCKKSKYGPEFDPISYQIEPLQWEQTVEPDDGEELAEGEEPETVTVRSATVRHQADEQALGTTQLRLPGQGRAPNRELPEVSEVPRMRKRHGVRDGRVRKNPVDDFDAMRAEGLSTGEAVRRVLAARKAAAEEAAKPETMEFSTFSATGADKEAGEPGTEGT